MTRTRLWLATLATGAIGLLAGCSEAASGGPSAQTAARIYAAPAGDALTSPSRGEPTAIVASYLRTLGVGRAAEQLQLTQLGSSRGYLRHLRFEQRIEGLRVHEAYVKATLDGDGRIVHLIEQIVPAAPVIAASVSPEAALLTALEGVGLSTQLPALLEVSGNVTRFARSPGLWREPTVERVAYVDDAGLLGEGFLVETWTLEENLLDYTLVGRDGAVLSVERRTNNDRYNVFAEDPSKGAQTIESGPTGTVESPAGWLGTGAQTAIDITGNNAHAYLDADANNAPDSGGTAVTNGDFLAAADLTQSPSSTGNRAVGTQNLFFHNNRVHDILYSHGFTEAEGNFQTDNFGRGGLGNDAVNAEAQDGGGTDNANFATPNDGSAPRMQMYLWSGAAPNSFVTIGTTDYGAYQSDFGPALTEAGVSGALALAVDATPPVNDGCEASTVSLTGRIALVDRGTCNFTVKVRNAQSAGAIAVIIMNNTGTDEAFGPGGTDRRVRIPSVMVGLNTGASLRSQVGTAANLRKNPVPVLQIDGDLDTDIVYHEYGHGLTWRMIGTMSGPLAGAVGEGASDVVAFLLNGDDLIGEYAASSAAGIRRQPYADYVGTYANANSGEVHNDGEIYAATMYDLLQLYTAAGHPVETLLSDFVGGMRFTPAKPAFEHMRDGMLQAVAGTGRECLIWRAFAGRGIGVGASGTVKGKSNVTIVESFTLPASCP